MEHTNENKCIFIKLTMFRMTKQKTTIAETLCICLNIIQFYVLRVLIMLLLAL